MYHAERCLKVILDPALLGLARGGDVIERVVVQRVRRVGQHGYVILARGEIVGDLAGLAFANRGQVSKGLLRHGSPHLARDKYAQRNRDDHQGHDGHQDRDSAILHP